MVRFASTTVAFALLAHVAFGSDGVLEINQTCAAAGCFPGDTAGFPVRITQRGSYRLTGALTSTSGTTAVLITANGVTLDLNGFIVTTAAPAIGAPGIDASGIEDVHVRNGTVEGFGAEGVWIGIGGWIENVLARGNGRAGILQEDQFGRVIGCSALGNTGNGITVGQGAVVSGNTVGGNSGTGIVAGPGSTVSENNVYANNNGIALSDGCTVLHNTVFANFLTGIRVVNGTTLIGNTVNGNGHCGVESLGVSAWAQNMVTANNGSSTNRQATGTLFPLETYHTTGDNVFNTNICSLAGASASDHCFTGPANNCP